MEHVPSRRHLLRDPFPRQPLDPRQLPILHPHRRHHRQLGIHVPPHEPASRRVLPPPHHPRSHNRHSRLHNPRLINHLLRHCVSRGVLRLPPRHRLGDQHSDGAAPERGACVCGYVRASELHASHHDRPSSRRRPPQHRTNRLRPRRPRGVTLIHRQHTPRRPPPQTSSTSAFMYFLTATFVAVLTLVLFTPLARRHTPTPTSPTPSAPARKVMSMPTLYRQLPFYSASIFLCFTLTMFFPVYTAQITSVHPAPMPRYLHAPIFIPLAFLIWNTGDLLGRLSTLFTSSLPARPRSLFAVSLARAIFLPLYALSNVSGRGAWVQSDLFYLLIVQLGFGLTNGWLASSAMMGATGAVGEEEREAAGAFMGFNLVAGLTAGSLLSFAAV
ncbi:hypothetical protein GMDG_02275 [Pseudogymnoascus destructans 20631-21]|uniref:Nucleoside transporter n=1 Tax=Pseudogymnoascus destructans (strain ATCC MYA-4855 / 20631-21) TaxID=658429 RepID=L8G0V1_PSED2|nr:hypothetical protein GMDG_02275 [Pseudogymnoascus destructans 20631-21]